MVLDCKVLEESVCSNILLKCNYGVAYEDAEDDAIRCSYRCDYGQGSL